MNLSMIVAMTTLICVSVCVFFFYIYIFAVNHPAQYDGGEEGLYTGGSKS